MPRGRTSSGDTSEIGSSTGASETGSGTDASEIIASSIGAGGGGGSGSSSSNTGGLFNRSRAARRRRRPSAELGELLHSFEAELLPATPTTAAGPESESPPLEAPPPASWDAAESDFYELSRWFDRHGWYEPSAAWYATRMAVCLALLAGSVACAWLYAAAASGATMIASSSLALAAAASSSPPSLAAAMSGDGGDAAAAARWPLVLGGLLLTAFWQQSGFMMHDAMHTQVHRSRRVCEALGTFFGTVCLGVSGMWWKDEHIVHHSITNTLDPDTGVTDPQMSEEVWAQNAKLLPFFAGSALRRLLVRVQHITFLPLVFFTGRVAIIADSFKDETRVRQWAAAACHWAWVAALLSVLPTWRDRALFYGVAALGQGVLHVQLLISHYAKPFESVHVAPHTGWFRHQALVNLNIDCPPWLDWFHGGLNLHIEHHLFPRLPRHNLRAAQPLVRALCARHGLPYDMVPFSTAVCRTLATLKEVGRLVDWVDPR
jgi:fatty acid desaturase